MKLCTKCLINKEFDGFRKAKAYKDGLHSWCKICEKDYQKTNKTKHNLAVKKWTEKNKELVKLKNDRLRKKYAENPIIILEKKCNTCKVVKSSDNFKKSKESKFGLHGNCNECHSIYSKKQYRKYKAKILAASRTYALIRKNRTPKWANIEKIKEIYKNRPEGYHVDHIIPLNGKNVCGLHVENNLQYLPAKDNLSKGNK